MDFTGCANCRLLYLFQIVRYLRINYGLLKDMIKKNGSIVVVRRRVEVKNLFLTLNVR